MAAATTRFTPQAVLGLFIIAAGLLLTGDNIGLFEADRIIRFWPLGIIIVGIVKFLQSSATPGKLVGVIIIFVGTVLTADKTFGLPVDLGDIWPLALVGLGLVILIRTLRPATAAPNVEDMSPDSDDIPIVTSNLRAPGGPASDPIDVAREAARKAREVVAGAPGVSTDESFSEVAVWAGKQRRIAVPSFQRADLTAIMGGVEIDLRAAGTAGGEAVIDVFVMWGGIEVWVPPDWVVVNKVGVLMGGVEDKSTGTQDARNRLVVRGFVIMGGMEIKT
jgi:hypothetical protein